MSADLSDPEHAELVSAWIGCPHSEERRTALLARLRNDANFRTAFASELRLIGMLQAVRASAPRWLRLEDELGWSAAEPGDFGDAVALRLATLPEVRQRAKTRWWAVGAAASILLGIVALMLLGERGAGLPPARIALVVRLDAAEWDGDSHAEGSEVGPGVLSVNRGTATLALFHGVTVHLEGPARIDLQSAERLVCEAGKVRIDAPAEAVGFTALAAGTVISPAAEFALTVAERGSAAIAVFEGRADVSVLDGHGQTVRNESLVGGQSARIEEGWIRIMADGTVERDFAGPIPKISPPLRLRADYPTAILADRPSQYWRFDELSGRRFANEIPNGIPLLAIGEAAPDEPTDGNRCLALPPANDEEQHGAISEQTWIPRHANFTLECWAMSRIVRQSSVLGLVTENARTNQDQHGILLELTGQPSPYRHPQRTVRALHRYPVGKSRGVNLFSTNQYLPYSWQHLVLRQSANRLELYVNGTLAGLGSTSAPGKLPPARLILGSLHATRDGSSATGRPFAGSLDEVAIYDHALTADQIRRHWELGSR